jgi:hypothetical protein
MAVVTGYSTALTNSKSTPRKQNNCGIEHGIVMRSQGFAVIANGDSVGSVYAICRVRSNDYIDKIRVDAPDIGTTTAADIGLYAIASDGAVVDQDCYASAIVLNAGAVSNLDVTFESAAAGGALANAEKRVWEHAGATSDPGGEYYLALTLTGAADAAGTALVRVFTVAA